MLKFFKHRKCVYVCGDYDAKIDAGGKRGDSPPIKKTRPPIKKIGGGGVRSPILCTPPPYTHPPEQKPVELN
jgi:hypothetical protein